MPEIFTIGHSNRSPEDFLATLACFGIGTLADVRTRPVSHFPHFKGEALAEILAEAGIAYVWLGPQLGGLRPGGYGAWMATLEFVAGIERLEALAVTRPTAFMCAERDPSHCHRQYIAATLKGRGWTVRHLIAPGQELPAAEEIGVQLGLGFD
ncbi:MAG: DUF488 domain-containing protein [Anaerolineae bacterium]